MADVMKKVLAGCLPLVALIIVAGGAAAGSPLEIGGERSPQAMPAEIQTTRSYRALLVDVHSVRLRFKKEPHPVLVDVRPADAFDRVRIPGSLNIPLHAIRSKGFLKTASLVLVNEGFLLRPLAKACERLRSDGFSVSILSGGLRAWHQAGGPLEGEPAAAVEFSQVSPRKVFQEKNSAFHLVVNVSAVRSRSSEEHFPQAVHVPFGGNPAAVADGIRLAVGSQVERRLAPILVVSETGLHYGRLEKVLRDDGLERTFFLTGGVAAYDRFRNDMTRSWKPRDSRIKTVGPCPRCGDDN